MMQIFRKDIEGVYITKVKVNGTINRKWLSHIGLKRNTSDNMKAVEFDVVPTLYIG